MRRVGAPCVTWIHTGLLAKQRDQTVVQERDAHALAAMDEQQLSELAILLVEERQSRLPALDLPAGNRVSGVLGNPDPARATILR